MSQNLITWEIAKNHPVGLMGYTESDIETNDRHTYEILYSSLQAINKCEHRSIDWIKFATVGDAKLAAELIEKGRCAE